MLGGIVPLGFSVPPEVTAQGSCTGGPASLPTPVLLLACVLTLSLGVF